ncbi:MAG: hypothetical protein CL977_01875 [Euryarchaeota archaeon]|nr:hypothetical protein [Euryarchaeota archaeon]
MVFLEFLLVLILVFITGFLFAPLGLGGGMLFVPILHYIAGWPLNTSTLVVSLLLTCCTSSGSGFIHHRQGLMQINRIRKGAPSALLGAIIGSLIVYLLRDELDPVFKTLAMAIVFWAIIKTWKKIDISSKKPVIREIIDNSNSLPEIKNLEFRVGTGFGGMASSVLAIGAGAIYVPVLSQFGGLESRQAIGTSYGLMIMVVPVGVIVHVLLYSGDWPSFWNVFFLPFAVLSGSILGAKVGLLLPEQIILRGFISILGIIFIRYFIDILTQIF